MAIWENSRCTTIYSDQRCAIEEICEVNLDGDRMVVDCRSVEEGWLWEGVDEGSGQYRFWCRKTQGEGTLNRGASGIIFEGSWSESGRYGMWTVTLGDTIREKMRNDVAPALSEN